MHLSEKNIHIAVLVYFWSIKCSLDNHKSLPSKTFKKSYRPYGNVQIIL